jgi:hypothetical protein
LGFGFGAGGGSGTIEFSFSGPEFGSAAGSLLLTFTNVEGTFTITSNTATVVKCAVEGGNDVVIIEGTGTLTRPDGSTEQGNFTLFTQDAAGPVPSGGQISFDFRNDNFSINFDNSSNLTGGFVAESIETCP